MENRPGSRHRLGGIRWLYALALVPSITELLENGRLPASLRALITDGVLTVVLLIPANVVCRQFRNIRRLTETDPATGLFNTGRFDEDFDSEVHPQRSEQDPVLDLIDVDEFKSVNDRLCHAAGSSILREVAGTLLAAVRRELDGCHRIGGDEFAVILPQADEREAVSIIERVLERANHESGPLFRSGTGLSVGVAALRPLEEPTEFFRRVDVLLYGAKAAGKNRVAVEPVGAPRTAEPGPSRLEPDLLPDLHHA